MLGDIGGGAGTAGRVEYEVTGIGSHKDAAFDYISCSLNHIDFLPCEASLATTHPEIVDSCLSEVIKEHLIFDAVSELNNAV